MAEVSFFDPGEISSVIPCACLRDNAPLRLQSLTDLLLLRQEVQLKELKQAEQVSAGILREMVDILTDIKVFLMRSNTSTGNRQTLTNDSIESVLHSVHKTRDENIC